MVNFIKPKYLSSKAKFEERYAEPIAAGQHSDSTPAEVKEMKKCSYALHEKLKVCVQVSAVVYLPFLVHILITETFISAQRSFNIEGFFARKI